MKIYAPDYFFPNDKTFWPSLDNVFTKDIFLDLHRRCFVG